ncbi:MAG: site-specific integrase [Geodermatophilaceae bacterium]|nr:site-specific integrase [Geodermatophilaceae bacterium]
MIVSGRKRGFGSIRRLPSGRYQARYAGPDAAEHKAPSTFDTRMDAEAWLTDRRREISRGEWFTSTLRPKVIRFGEYSANWLAERTLKPRSRAHYASLLDRLILPTFAETPLRAITPAAVRAWHVALGTDRPTLRAHAYGLLRGILATAVSDGEVAANPCHIRGAGSSRRVHKIQPASLDELEALVREMPAKYRAMTLLASWCGLRFGELTELRRKDLDLTNGVIHVRRGIAWVNGRPVVGTPKSAAGIRDVAIPPHLLPVLRQHVAEHAAWGRDGLVFPAVSGGPLASSTLYRSFYPARARVGRPDLRWHDLRHTGAVLAAATGATLAELMGRLGHSTPGAALRYQHAAQGRDAEIASRLSELAQAQLRRP